MRFTGNVPPPSTNPTAYFADRGNTNTSPADTTFIISPLEYTLPVDRTFENMTVRLPNGALGGVGNSITFDLLQDGVAVMSVTFTGGVSPDTLTTIASVPYLAGQVFDVRSSSAGPLAAIIPATIVVGIS